MRFHYKHLLWLVVLAGFIAIAWWLFPRSMAFYYQIEGGKLLAEVMIDDDRLQTTACAALPIETSTLKLQRALDHLEHSLAYGVGNSQAALLAGRAYCLLGKPENAVKSYLVYLHQRPGSLLGQLELGFAYLAAGDPTAAAEAWQAAGLSAWEFIEVGDSMAQAQQQAGAIVWYNRALVIQPGLADAWYALGLAYQQQEQWSDAINAYTAALEAETWQNVQPGDVYYRLGQIYQNAAASQDLEKALEMYAAALDSDAFSSETIRADVHYKRGEIYFWLGRRPSESMAEYRQAIALDPEHYWAHLRLGQALYQTYQDVDRAVVELQLAIDCWPSGPSQKWPYRILGDIYQEAGMTTEAIAAYQEALRFDPQDEQVADKLAALSGK
jgi:superkiller protein 3